MEVDYLEGWHCTYCTNTRLYKHHCSSCGALICKEHAGAFPDTEDVLCTVCQHDWAVKEMGKCFPMFRMLP